MIVQEMGTTPRNQRKITDIKVLIISSALESVLSFDLIKMPMF